MLFSKKHIWIDENNGIAKLGITEYAQEKLKSILFVNLPDLGDDISLDDTFGDIESVKTVIDLHTPVSGKVISVNEELVDEPESINDAPFDSWLIEIEITEKSSDLMNESEYNDYIRTL